MSSASQSLSSQSKSLAGKLSRTLAALTDQDRSSLQQLVRQTFVDEEAPDASERSFLNCVLTSIAELERKPTSGNLVSAARAASIRCITHLASDERWLESSRIAICRAHPGQHEPEVRVAKSVGQVETQYSRAHASEAVNTPTQVLGYRIQCFFSEMISPPSYSVIKGKDPGFSIIRILPSSSSHCSVDVTVEDSPWNTTRGSGFTSEFRDGLFTLCFKFLIDRYRR